MGEGNPASNGGAGRHEATWELARKHLLLLANDYKAAGSEILLVDWLSATLGLPPLGLVRLDTLAPLRPPPVEDDPDLLVPSEIPLQIVVEVRLVVGHDYEVPFHPRLLGRSPSKGPRPM